MIRLNIILLALTNIVQVLSQQELIILEAVRTIDIEGQLTKVTTEVTFFNNGSKPIEYFNWTISENGILSFIEVLDSQEQEQKVVQNAYGENKLNYLNIYFPRTLEPSTSIELTVSEIYAKGLTPLPKKIKQSEDQYMIYDGNLYLQSPYYISLMSTMVLLPSSQIESYSQDNNTELKNKIINYGPYRNIMPFTTQGLNIHCKNNEMFLIVPKLKRKIRVSLWGTIFIEEEVHLYHHGAKLKGPFSAQLDVNYRPNILKRLKIILPASATNVDFHDEIGKISSFTVEDNYDHVDVYYKPRFVLFGGWKIKYNMTYELPVYEYVYQNQDDKNIFTLKMRFIDNIFPNMFVEKIETHIELPALANVFSMKFPYSVRNLPSEYAYLPFDLFGIMKPRQILIFSKENLVENHIKDFEIKFQWDMIDFLYQPFLIAAFLFHIFVFVIVYIRLDFSLVDYKKKIMKNFGSGDLKKQQ